MSTPTINIPGYQTGTWAIDPIHSDVSFIVRHLGVSKVRGQFNTFSGEIVTAEDPLQSTVTATIDAGSFHTRQEQRDNHVKAEDFLHVADHPEIKFVSTGIRQDGADFLLDGELTIRGVTKPVTLELEINGFGQGPDGTPVVGISASTEINRKDFGVHGGAASPMVGEKIKIALEIEAGRTAE
ncbi:YceI family protein [Kibdelosporangium persicum]|uniref:Polyisoprenoid-binding protein YceI n=1 Tax=Kibdelosporangium persicum TaxID=2698649 RepID=A0ABX2EZC3_9PSEU|nr:YceI family protein [Kibdelosporangium persicum]NRN64403.1 Polyisoprenoid-binding protein YceI [Kibdelosporangium persicum]